MAETALLPSICREHVPISVSHMRMDMSQDPE
jgi:hypothetical protein